MKLFRSEPRSRRSVSQQMLPHHATDCFQYQYAQQYVWILISRKHLLNSAVNDMEDTQTGAKVFYALIPPVY